MQPTPCRWRPPPHSKHENTLMISDTYLWPGTSRKSSAWITVSVLGSSLFILCTTPLDLAFRCRSGSAFNTLPIPQLQSCRDSHHSHDHLSGICAWGRRRRRRRPPEEPTWWMQRASV